MAKVPNQRWASGIAAANQLQAKNLQETAMAENCILVDEFDRAIGQSSKRDCHRVDDNGQLKLHRAFSVFLFNSDGDMLIQKRSPHKVNTRLTPAYVSKRKITVNVTFNGPSKGKIILFHGVLVIFPLIFI